MIFSVFRNLVRTIRMIYDDSHYKNGDFPVTSTEMIP